MANDLGLGLPYALQGLDQVLAQRKAEQIAAQQRAHQQQQQAFENNLKMRNEMRLEDVMKGQQADRQAGRDEQDFTRAGVINQATPDGAFLPKTDQGAQLMQKAGYGGFLKTAPAIAAQGNDFQGPTPEGSGIEDYQQGRPEGYIHSATAQQLEQQAKDKAAAQKEQASQNNFNATLAENTRYHTGMINKKSAGGDSNNRLDRSYQYNSGALEKIAKPIEDQASRLERLQTTINQYTPQADALLAPELLTVMAGGQGSGLRINEAEIQRVVGGRSNLEGLKAALNKWSIDPTQALSVTPAQREQMKALVQEVYKRGQAQLGSLDDARSALAGSQDVNEHRNIVARLHKTLRNSSEPQPNVTAAASGQNPAASNRIVYDMNGNVVKQ